MTYSDLKSVENLLIRKYPEQEKKLRETIGDIREWIIDIEKIPLSKEITLTWLTKVFLKRTEIDTRLKKFSLEIQYRLELFLKQAENDFIQQVQPLFKPILPYLKQSNSWNLYNEDQFQYLSGLEKITLIDNFQIFLSEESAVFQEQDQRFVVDLGHYNSVSFLFTVVNDLLQLKNSTKNTISVGYYAYPGYYQLIYTEDILTCVYMQNEDEPTAEKGSLSARFKINKTEFIKKFSNAFGDFVDSGFHADFGEYEVNPKEFARLVRVLSG